MAHRRLEFEVHNKEKEKEDELTDNAEELINERHSNISNDKIPCIGMEFDTEEAAYQFYNSYAKATGFSIRRDVVHTSSDGRILDRIFLCSCEGQRKKDIRDVIVRAPRPETRKGCRAMMKINGRQRDNYVVQKFVAIHKGHGLASPTKSYLLRSHRSITPAQALQVDDIESSGITPKSGFELLARQSGGRDKLGFIFEDYKNHLQSQRTKTMKVSDTRGVLEYLQQRQIEDPNFLYAIQVDEHGMITNIFWCDARMRDDFTYFGDVLCFDTTYRKLNEDRPIALFVGVNHHKQTIIFGAALLYDETANTFCWLFDIFARAMSGKKPQTILTDQDAAMAKALAIKWPETWHRLCIWHIYQNAASHLSDVFSHFSTFKDAFSSCIYDYEDEDGFIEAWEKMLAKYGLEKDTWLQRMFSLREKWALAYGRQVFCGDMISTQRSESMNSALTRYVNSKKDMLRFFQHFQRLIDDRRYQEMKADFWTSQSTPELPLKVEILKHARNVYTHAVFKLFQDELSKAYDSIIEVCNDIGEISEYKVGAFQKHYSTVAYNSTTGEVSCSCKKFEFAGTLCFHVLKVFSLRNVVRIPKKYIMKRWTKDARKWLVELQPSPLDDKLVEPVNENNERKMIGVRYKELCVLLNKLVARASLTLDSSEILKSFAFKTYEVIDASVGKKTAPHTGAKSNAKEVVEAIVSGKETFSKVCNKETFVSESSGGAFNHSRSTVDNIAIRGLKIKEKEKGKSGKRPKSGLEKATRKKKQKVASVSSLGTSSMSQCMNENSVQNLHNPVNNLSLSATAEPLSVRLLSQPPYLPQPSQEGGYIMSSLSPYYPIQEHPISQIEAFSNLQMNTFPFYPSNDQHTNSSLTKLLQDQLKRQK